MIKYTEIEQFRNVIRQVKVNTDYKGLDKDEQPIYRHDQPYPILKFRGTIKLHGTNSGIVLYKDNHVEFQSRERVLDLTSDNAGFMLAIKGTNYIKLFDNIPFNDYVAIYGEWCGKNIQKGIAISNVPNMFVIFAIRIDGVWQDMENYKPLKIEEERIFNILQFEHYYMDIDFEHPELAQNELVNKTIAVETECPVGKYFGFSGIGEGIVWEYINSDRRYIFKVKGEKHSNSKVKKLATIDTEEVKNIQEFVDYAVTENRLKQGIDKLIELGKSIEMSSTPVYLRWVYNDVVKEEEDTIIKNGIDVKKIGSAISSKARIFWLNYVNSSEVKVG